MFDYTIDFDSIAIKLDKESYSLKVIKKVTLWFANSYFIDIEKGNKDYTINLKPHKNTSSSKEELENDVIKFNQNLVDFELQDIVNEETKAIRELLIAKAFYHSDD